MINTMETTDKYHGNEWLIPMEINGLIHNNSEYSVYNLSMDFLNPNFLLSAFETVHQ